MSSTLNEQDIRAEAAEWLQDSLNEMNNEGAHWVQGSYRKEMNDFGVLEFAYCAMGGLGKTLEKRILAADMPELLPSEDDLMYDEDGDEVASYKVVDAEGSPVHNFADIIKAYPKDSQRDYTPEELALLEKFDATLTVSEVALAWGMAKYAKDNRPYLYGAVVMDTRANGQGGYEITRASHVDAAHQIVSFNDANTTKWDDIKASHQIAIDGLKSGEAPTNWEQYGELLLDDIPDYINEAVDQETGMINYGVLDQIEADRKSNNES